MENVLVNSKAEVFLSCKKEKHYSREVIMPKHALVRVLSGEMKIVAANHSYIFHAGDTFFLPRYQLGKVTKIPLNGEDFKSITIYLPLELVQKYYASHPIEKSNYTFPTVRSFVDHPLLESLFGSLQPYFSLRGELPEEIATVKIMESIAVLRTIDPGIDNILGHFETPGKIDLEGFMEQHYMFNLTAEKFGHLTGRSLTTFKRDFKKTFNSTPEKWLTKKRLEKAHYEIFEKKRRPTDVYFEVGFENLSHFSFAFKKQFGYNPTSMK